MPDPRGALLAGLRRAYSVNDDKLRGARVLAGARARRDQNDHSGLLDALRKFDSVRHAQGPAGGVEQSRKAAAVSESREALQRERGRSKGTTQDHRVQVEGGRGGKAKDRGRARARDAGEEQEKQGSPKEAA